MKKKQKIEDKIIINMPFKDALNKALQTPLPKKVIKKKK